MLPALQISFCHIVASGAQVLQQLCGLQKNSEVSSEIDYGPRVDYVFQSYDRPQASGALNTTCLVHFMQHRLLCREAGRVAKWQSSTAAFRLQPLSPGQP